MADIEIVGGVEMLERLIDRIGERKVEVSSHPEFKDEHPVISGALSAYDDIINIMEETLLEISVDAISEDNPENTA